MGIQNTMEKVVVSRTNEQKTMRRKNDIAKPGWMLSFIYDTTAELSPSALSHLLWTDDLISSFPTRAFLSHALLRWRVVIKGSH